MALLVGSCLSACTLLFPALLPPKCTEGAPSFCRDDLLLQCIDGFESSQDCGPGLCSINNGAALCLENNDACGDGIINGAEQCDDGNQTPDDGCENDCTLTPPITCGDGIIQPPEECDDANQAPDDGCESNCTLTPEPICGDGIIDVDEQCDDGNNISGDSCEADCTNPINNTTDLAVSSLVVERHNQDLQYLVTVSNTGTTNVAANIQVDIYHSLNSAPTPGTPGDRSTQIPGLAAGASITVPLLLAVAEDPFDAPGTTRDDFARVDTFDTIAETDDTNNLAGPVNGAVTQDFCSPCAVEVGSCITINETDESFCSDACASNADCNSDSECVTVPGVGDRCRPIVDTCHAHCEPGSLVFDVVTQDFADNGDGTFTATITGSTAGLPNRTQPNDGGSDDPCNSNEGPSGEAFFILRLTEGSFPAGLLGSATSANLTVDTLGTDNFGPDNDTILYLRTDCMDERPTAQIDCDDDSGIGPQNDAELTVPNLSKGSYTIILDGFGSNNDGPFVVNITVDPN